jgi:hypothetical protein
MKSTTTTTTTTTATKWRRRIFLLLLLLLFYAVTDSCFDCYFVNVLQLVDAFQLATTTASPATVYHHPSSKATTTTTTTITRLSSIQKEGGSIDDDDERHIDAMDDDVSSSSSSPGSTHIIFPGGGIYFYYQAGIVQYLREEGYDLSSQTFSGASAGALTATLTSTDVDFYGATELALDMAREAGVWDRRSGLQGIWGPLIEEWLDRLLPPSIDTINDGRRLTLLVTPVPNVLEKTKVSTFEDRQDLIKCNMASVHIPWFLDGRLVRYYRDRPHIDGSFLSKPTDYVPHPPAAKPPTLVLDGKDDPFFVNKNPLDFVEALTPEGIYGLLAKGKKYAAGMEEKGLFDNLPKRKR